MGPSREGAKLWRTVTLLLSLKLLSSDGSQAPVIHFSQPQCLAFGLPLQQDCGVPPLGVCSPLQDLGGQTKSP